MNEIFISLVIVVVLVYGFYWLGGKIADPVGQVIRIVALAGGFLWLLFNLRAIITGIASI